MKHLELHILQSVPVSCLNRDDLGSPKTAVFGGVQRSRISSQCWKRAIRELAKELLPHRFTGERTRLIVEPLRDSLLKHGEADTNTALDNAIKLAEALATFDKDAKTKKGKFQVKTLFFTLPNEIDAIAAKFMETKDVKKSLKAAGGDLCKDAADLALFGRMVANSPDLKLEGTAMFSHALSTHKSNNEIDFFSALDDLQPEEESGAGITGTLEYNASTYYRFVALNLDMLADAKHLGALGLEERKEVVSVFVEAVLKAMPAARKNSMNANILPGYVLCVLRDTGHPIQLANAFEQAVWSPQGEGMLQPSIKKMEKEYAELQEKWGISGMSLRMPEVSLADMLKKVKDNVI
jgi:CRISPR system Cascade subunit CasC